MGSNSHFIVKHAFDNILNIHDDSTSSLIYPAMISGVGGIKNTLTHLWTTLAMPEREVRFTVYEMGRIDPDMLGIDRRETDRWYDLADVAQKAKILMEVTTTKGVIIPRHFCYYYITNDFKVTLAIRRLPGNIGIDIEKEEVMVRVYRNLIYQHITPDPLIMGGATIKSDDQVSTIANYLANEASEHEDGKLICSCNGVYLDLITPSNVTIGDEMDWIFDASIHRQVDYNVNSLLPYTSHSKGRDYYVLTHNENINVVEHINNIDFYVIIERHTGSFGYPVRQHNNAVMQLTHRDYAIGVEEVSSRLEKLGGVKPGEKAYVRAFFRRTQQYRKLIDEDHRIKELYKLTYSKRRLILAGLEGPECWHAENLEGSKYIQLMTADFMKVTRNQVMSAYGYNALSKILGDTPIKPKLVNGRKTISVPYGLQFYSTGYEYDCAGKLIAVQINEGRNTYICKSQDTEWVELVHGIGSPRLDLALNTNVGEYRPGTNYRFYAKKNGQWCDVSETNEVEIHAGVWLINHDANICAAMSNRRHLYVEREIVADQGLLEVVISHQVGNTLRPLPFNLGEYDVFLNGHPLIEGIDFVVDFPYIRITNKKFIKQTPDMVQKVAIRGMNFCNSDMTHRKPEEVGFVKDGVLSNNSKNDLRDDRVYTIYCNGSFYAPKELVFSQISDAVLIGFGQEGKPYALNHIIVPMSNYIVSERDTIDSTEKARLLSLSRDFEINEYLDTQKPLTDVLNNVEITEKYKLYSPFFSKIIHDMDSGYFWDPRFDDGQELDDDELDALLDHYKPLLVGDPINAESEDFDKYIIIEPVMREVPFSFNLYRKRILDRIVEKYSNGKIQIEDFITTLVV